jgi:hypothetical protein
LSASGRQKVEDEVARECRRQAESQGGTTIAVGTKASTSDFVMSVSPDSQSAVPGSSDSLPPSLEAMLGLPEREDIPPKEDLDLEGLFWLPPDLEDQSHAVPPSASAPRASPVEACAIRSRALCCVGREELPEGSQVDSYLLARAP